MKPTNCCHDIIPSKIIKQTLEVIGPSLLILLNKSLQSGEFPASFKHAIVEPLLKKTNVLSNYRPISKLPFISKVLEKAVLNQLQAFLVQNDIYEKFQSGFKVNHSTETALLKVSNYILSLIDSDDSVILILLDLSAAFDTIDHNILITRLEKIMGIRGTALEWFRSFLSNRSFSVNISQFYSKSAPLHCGVPYGSILGPILFILYMLPLGSIFKRHGVFFTVLPTILRCTFLCGSTIRVQLDLY